MVSYVRLARAYIRYNAHVPFLFYEEESYLDLLHAELVIRRYSCFRLVQVSGRCGQRALVTNETREHIPECVT